MRKDPQVEDDQAPEPVTCSGGIRLSLHAQQGDNDEEGSADGE